MFAEHGVIPRSDGGKDFIGAASPGVVLIMMERQGTLSVIHHKQHQQFSAFQAAQASNPMTPGAEEGIPLEVHDTNQHVQGEVMGRMEGVTAILIAMSQ